MFLLLIYMFCFYVKKLCIDISNNPLVMLFVSLFFLIIDAVVSVYIVHIINICKSISFHNYITLVLLFIVLNKEWYMCIFLLNIIFNVSYLFLLRSAE